MQPSSPVGNDTSTYKILTKVILKETESGRDNKEHAFPIQIHQDSRIQSIKEQIWQFVAPHSIDASPPTPEDFDQYVVFKHYKQIITEEDNA
ncbi:hypothetical protein LEN26_003613 [Aphanomyces euteiches]|nr:hypothetical protein AeMF1_016550 [Aphanomyces euteiches]KAH9153008.1 hypothetical protein LEN26_003613 [Aphanomyces euteiches]KAH9165496.1 hypothetical protein AeNC1_018508 [Aphanomyces euteiches]